MKSISVSLPVVLNANIIDWELLAYEIIEDDTVSDEDLTRDCNTNASGCRHSRGSSAR